MSSYFENRKPFRVMETKFQYGNKNQNFISNFAFQFIKKNKK